MIRPLQRRGVEVPDGANLRPLGDGGGMCRVLDAAGDIRRFLVFDPKYSVSRASVLAAMETAHIYRDCLRGEGRAPDLSLLLIPANGAASWLEDPAFHADHGGRRVPLFAGKRQGSVTHAASTLPGRCLKVLQHRRMRPICLLTTWQRALRPSRGCRVRNAH